MTKICECGCGRVIKPMPKHKYRPVRFLPGHRSKQGEDALRLSRRITPKPEEIPSGLCECGCGGKTAIANRTEAKKRWFKGYPVPRLGGHGQRQLGEANHRWRGGRSLTVHGYIVLYMPTHPHADKKGYVREHRHVWEQANGRTLQTHEHIHHINGIKDDNRLENLVMLTKIEHAKEHGARALQAYRQARPGFNSRAGKRGADVRWKGHVKKS